MLAERVLGLRRIYLPRAGYGFTAGFPVCLASSFAQRALRAGYAVVIPPHMRRRRRVEGFRFPVAMCPAGVPFDRAY